MLFRFEQYLDAKVASRICRAAAEAAADAAEAMALSALEDEKQAAEPNSRNGTERDPYSDYAQFLDS